MNICDHNINVAPSEKFTDDDTVVRAKWTPSYELNI